MVKSFGHRLRDRRFFFGRRASFLYELIGWQFRNAHDLRFMNYGFDDPDLPGRHGRALSGQAERYCAQLYDAVASQTVLAGKRILDVGSGRGGGLSFLHGHHAPRMSVGLDFAAQAVRFCQRTYRNTKGLSFKHGDAQAMPFPDSSFDAVLNVESAHCYPDPLAFFAEVRRVLAPGGVFLFADFTTAGGSKADLSRIDADLRRIGFGDVRFTDITGGIVRGLDHDTDRRLRKIRQHFPLGTRRLASLWAGTRGSWIYEDFRTGRRSYFMCRASVDNFSSARCTLRPREEALQTPPSELAGSLTD